MYNNIKELRSFIIEMAHDVEVDDVDLAEDLLKLAETLKSN